MAKKSIKKKIKPIKWCICTEGETEAMYLGAYCAELGIRDLIDINSDNSKCKKLSGKACGRKHRPLIDQMLICHIPRLYERVIALHDYDEYYNEKGKSTHTTFDEASEIGANVEIEVYYSIPSFEFWLLLHLNFYQNNMTRFQCQDIVKDHVNKMRKEQGHAILSGDKYKTTPDIFEYFGGISGAKLAKTHALKLFKKGQPPKKPSSVKPSTNIFLLMDELYKLAQRQNK